MNTRKLMINIGRAIRRDSTKIFAGAAIAAQAIGYYCMHKEAPIVRDKIKALPENATGMDKFKAAAPVYIPAAGMFLISSGCIIGGCIAGERKAALMAGLYSASEAALRRYEEKVVEKIGPEKAQEIRRETANDILERHSEKKVGIIATGCGDELFYDTLSGRYFTSDKLTVRNACNSMNRLIIGDVWGSLNEWYIELGLDEIGAGDYLGWNVDHLMDIDFDTADTPFERPCYVIHYRNEPVLYK